MNRKILLISLIVLSGLIITILLLSRSEQREPITITMGVVYEEKSLDDLIQDADLIVVCKVDSILPSRWSTPNEKRPNDDAIPDHIIYTDVIIQVTQTLKGENKSPAVRIRTLGGQVGIDQMIVSLETHYEIGHHYLLFLFLDTQGSTANVGPEHYFEDGYFGPYEIIDGKAISRVDEWPLEELIAYIQNALLNSQ